MIVGIATVESQEMSAFSFNYSNSSPVTLSVFLILVKHTKGRVILKRPEAKWVDVLRFFF